MSFVFKKAGMWYPEGYSLLFPSRDKTLCFFSLGGDKRSHSNNECSEI